MRILLRVRYTHGAGGGGEVTDQLNFHPFAHFASPYCNNQYDLMQ